MEFLERLAIVIPPPRRHRHRYHGILAPNAPLRAAVTARAGLPDGGIRACGEPACPSARPNGNREIPFDFNLLVGEVARPHL